MFAGTIINADSQQRYRDFPLLTAQPSDADRARAPHCLFGDLAATDVGTAAEWAGAAAAEIARASSAGRLPIVVGGTGLYLRVLMQGVAEIPSIPDAVRDAARALVAEIGNEELHRRLAARDPVGATRIPAGNTQRLTRAWEVIEATGTPLSVWHDMPAQHALDANYFSILLMPPREAVVAACDARFRGMIDAGVLREVEAAVASGIDPGAPAMNALGAVALSDHLAGKLDLEGAIEAAQIATRQYAKRQATWFRHQFDPDMILRQTYEPGLAETVAADVRHFLSKGSL